jgi:hypothetical protein
LTEPRPSYAPENATPGRRRGRAWSVAGIISGGSGGRLDADPVRPPLGIVSGIVGFVKGDRGPGIAAIIVGVLGLVIGLVVSAVLLSVMNQT